MRRQRYRDMTRALGLVKLYYHTNSKQEVVSPEDVRDERSQLPNSIVGFLISSFLLIYCHGEKHMDENKLWYCLQEIIQERVELWQRKKQGLNASR